MLQIGSAAGRSVMEEVEHVRWVLKAVAVLSSKALFLLIRGEKGHQTKSSSILLMFEHSYLLKVERLVKSAKRQNC